MAIGITDVWAAPGKRGDKIWCGVVIGGTRYVAWGSSMAKGLADGNIRGVLEFSNISKDTKKPIHVVKDEKVDKGYRLVGRFKVDFSTGKAVWCKNQAATSVEDEDGRNAESDADDDSSMLPIPPKPVLRVQASSSWVW